MIFLDVDVSSILSAVMSDFRNGPLVEVPYRRGEAVLKNQRYIFYYFTVESALLLFWLTASVLFLPLMLPTLPPPPFILLLLPIAILLVLMVMMKSNWRGHKCVLNRLIFSSKRIERPKVKMKRSFETPFPRGFGKISKLGVWCKQKD